ncbi:DRC7 [Symbiodinium sp. CCMP2592]|nr:DRC7 [Symbiodinium sp. CCMP2592]
MARFWHSCALCAALIMPLLMTPPISDPSDEEVVEDSTGPYLQVGATFFAVAVMVWTFVAAWLCYSGPLTEGVLAAKKTGIEGQKTEGEPSDISESVLQRVAQGFADFIIENSRKEDPSGGEMRSLDLAKFEELVAVAPAAAASALYGYKGGSGPSKETKEKDISFGVKETPSQPSSKPSDKKAQGRAAQTPASRCGSCVNNTKSCSCYNLSTPDGNIQIPQLDTPHLNLFKELLRDRLVANLMGEGSQKISETTDEEVKLAGGKASSSGLASLNPRLPRWFSGPDAEQEKSDACLKPVKEDALEELLLQLLQSTSIDDKITAPWTSQRHRNSKGSAKDSGTSTSSMAEHAREVGNKYFKEQQFATAVHCYEVAALLCPSGSACQTEQLASYHCNCALACLHLHRYGDAVSECRSALVLMPSMQLTVKALHRLAAAHIYLRNFWEAARCLQNCLELEPSNDQVRKLLEAVQVLESQRSEARSSRSCMAWADIGKIQCVSRDKSKKRRGKQKKGMTLSDEVRQLDREAGIWHTMVSHNSKLYIFGGFSDGGEPLGQGDARGAYGISEALGSDEFHVLDLESMELRQLYGLGAGAKPPQSCYCHTATVVGNSMLVFGGCGPSFDQLPGLMVYDFAQGKWRCPPCSGTPPRQRQGHSACAVQDDSCLCVFGGIELTIEQGIGRVYNDAVVLDVTSWTWTKQNPSGNIPAARFGHAATTLPRQSSCMLVIGGRDHMTSPKDALVRDHTGLHILDTARQTWTEQSFGGRPPEKAFYPSTCLIDDQTLLFLSGSRGRWEPAKDVLEVFLLDLEAWVWSRPCLQGIPPCPRVGQTVAAVGDRVYLFGGLTLRGDAAIVDKAVYLLETTQERRLDGASLAQAKASDLKPTLKSLVPEPGFVESCAKTPPEEKNQRDITEKATTAGTTPCDSPRGTTASSTGDRGASLVEHFGVPECGEPQEEDEEMEDEPELSFEELLEQEKAFFKTQSKKTSFPRSQATQEVRRKENRGKKGSKP